MDRSQTETQILFHPRTLGTDPYLSSRSTLASAFHLKDATTYSVDRARTQNGVIAVKASFQADQKEFTYFIDTGRDYALASVEYRFAEGHTATIVNELALWPGDVWFPAISEMRSRNAGEDERTTILTTLAADFTDVPLEKSFKFEGMNLEPGTRVDDWFQMRATHVWDGSRMVPYDEYIRTRPKSRAESPDSPPTVGSHNLGTIAVIGILPVVAFALLVFCRGRRV